MKNIIDLYYRYENELEVMLPQFKQELADMLFQSTTTTTTKLSTNKPENVSKNKTPHFTTDFATPLSRHDTAPKNETTKTTQLDVCQNCFERHSLALRLCRNCGEEHDGCCEIMVT